MFALIKILVATGAKSAGSATWGLVMTEPGATILTVTSFGPSFSVRGTVVWVQVAD
jgi:hypothetical protein